MKAKIDRVYESLEPWTLLDEYECVWRIVADNADGTFAVEQVIEESFPDVDQWAIYGDRPCAVAVWDFLEDDVLKIYRCQNYKDKTSNGDEYRFGDRVLEATPEGWEDKEN